MSGTAVVTATQPTKSSISAGGRILEISGRPLFAFPGSFPFYRTLTSGDSGPDVRQLQEGLVSAGLLPGADGNFGAATESAITTLYARAGYAPAKADASSTSSDANDGTGFTSQDTSTASAKPNPGAADASPASVSHVTVPAAELLTVASLPAQLQSEPELGTIITSDSSISFVSGATQLVGTVPQLNAEDLKVGTSGTFTADGGTPIPVQVASISKGATDSADSTIVVTGRGVPLSDDVLTKTGVVSLEVNVVGKDTLIVPTVAVSPGGSGPAHLLVKQADGSFARITVEETGQLDGQSGVKPNDPKDLKAGDEVRVD